MRKYKAGILLVAAVLILGLAVKEVQAKDAAQTTENTRDADEMQTTENADESAVLQGLEDELSGKLDYSEVDRVLEELFPEEKLDFGEMVREMISGDTKASGELLGRLLYEQLFYAFSSCRKNLVQILVITLIASVFQNFAQVFGSRQAAEISFYVLYLLLIALCLNSFQIAMDWVSGGIKNLTRFMSVFCPVYFLAVSIAKGSVTAVGFYHLALVLIYLVEVVIVSVLLPCIHIFIMVKILDFLSEQEYLSKFAELTSVVVSWILKTLLACIIGLNVIQGMISPAIDTVKRSALTRGVEAVPGVGDAIGGVTEVVLGTAVLLKNGIGTLGLIVCLALIIAPLVQIGCIALLYKLAAAVIQPVSDKRIVGCVESVADGCKLLLQAVFTAGVLFLITIVIVSFVTSK